MASRSLAPVSGSRSRSRSRTSAVPALLDPFRLMNSLLTDAVSARPSDGDGNDLLLAQPRMDIEDTGDEIRVTAELPGVSEDNVQITLDDDMLIIAGEKRDSRRIAIIDKVRRHARALYVGRHCSSLFPVASRAEARSGTLWSPDLACADGRRSGRRVGRLALCSRALFLILA